METTRIIRVLLVDDHAVVRRGLEALLMVYDDLEFIGEASNGLEAIEKCLVLRPDVVMMDLIMPEMDGATATQTIRLRCPGTQVVVLTSFKEDSLVEGALRAGAIGYLLKSASAEELARAIRSASAGKSILAPEAAQVLIYGNHATSPVARFDLTAREKEVLRLMSKGLNNVEIADRLTVSRSTIKFHVSSVLSKLGVNSRTEAVSVALKNKMI